jgi:YgiT-type zinc finger domain-containing protein
MGKGYGNKEEREMKCFICKGDLEEKKVNYVVDLEETIIIVKGVPAKVCNQCGEQYFDDETAENIEKIVNQLKQLATEITVVNYKEEVA